MQKTDVGGFLKLEQELKPYIGVMSKAADAIMEKEISKYPILVVHQQEVELGVPVLKKEAASTWLINASTLEEFVMKNLIQSEKLEDFQSVYKDPKEQICLFVLSELGAQFVFLKR
ncbi:MAG: hypothetical protein KTR24_06740 [Saprospiraceae bacterium]|nr:hypothetical protein [Saprospiraceae bacterium]